MSSGDWSGGDGGGSSWDSAGSTGGDRYTESSTEGWFSRIGKAFLAIPIGLLLFVISFVVLLWNEGRAVQTAEGLAEGKAGVVSIEPDKVDPANDARLVHLNGEATTDETLKDPVFGLAFARSIRLRRMVRMYQWTETSKTQTRKKLGGGEERITTYDYQKGWTKQPIDSSHFKKPEGHENPNSWPFDNWTGQAQKVTVGVFSLPKNLIDQVGNPQPLRVTQDQLDRLPPDVKSGLVLSSGQLYRGNDPYHPEVGDVCVAFDLTQPQPVSLLAKQVGGTFEPYKTRAGTTIERLQPGPATAEAMFQQAESENNVLTWVLRLVGFVLMAVGISMVLSPLSVFADVVPFIGNIVEFGTGFVAVGLASVLSLVTIAIGWMAYRPIIGFSILAGAGVILFLFWKRAKDHRAPRPSQA